MQSFVEKYDWKKPLLRSTIGVRKGAAMIDLATVGLLTAGVKLANDVMSLYGNSRKALEGTIVQDTGSDSPPREAVIERYLVEHQQVIEPHHLVERQQVIREKTIITERVLDKEFVERIVKQAVSNLDKLIIYTGTTILDELHRSRVRDAVQEVKARASALRILLNASELDASLVVQMITGALNPLQVSLEKARYVMEDFGNKEGWEYCYLVGSAALLAGYNYLGQQPQYLEEQLIEHSRDVHSAILDEIAAAKFAAGQKFPWRDVPALLNPAGADALRALFEEVVGTSKQKGIVREIKAGSPERSIEGKGKTQGKGIKVPFQVASYSIPDLQRKLRQVEDPRIIDAMMQAEKKGLNRIGALRELERRKQKIS